MDSTIKRFVHGTPQQRAPVGHSGSGHRHYLLVIDEDAARVVQLPREGTVSIGRGEDVDIRLDDPSVSRTHARIVMTEHDARIADADSQNGTLVNDEPLTASRSLLSADVIAIGAITLVYHSSRQRSMARPILGFDQLRRRAEEELERSLRYHRAFSLFVADLNLGDAVDRPVAARALAGRLRLLDVVAWSGAEHLIVLMPESGPEVAKVGAARLLDALRGIAPEARVGVASFPADGCNVETLLVGARAAAAAAPPGGHASAGATWRRLQIGKRAVVVADPAMSRLYALIERLAAADLPILICGETGTGKELAATALHVWSARRDRPMVTVNCAALVESIVESALFGHEKGAFTGAQAAKAGFLEAADGGTIFLDEIGELSVGVQAKLLRVLEDKRVTRLGDVREREIDVRVVAATNRNLEDDVRAGLFRRDLFFRLSGGTVWIPPLRDRPRELPLLAHAFLEDACARPRRPMMQISDSAMRVLATHVWPGNARELKNLMGLLVATLTETSVIEDFHVAGRLGRATEPASGSVPAPLDGPPPPQFRPIDEEIRDLERSRLIAALAATNGNQTRAAELISMPRRTFVAKLRQYELVPGARRSRH